MSLGIIVVAIGLGLMTIVSVAGGAPEAGVGIGGAIVILGLAFIANSLVSRNNPPDALPPARRDDLS
jgi:nitrogenase subunit NifH